MPIVDIYPGPMRGAIGLLCETCFPVEKCLVPTSAPYAIVWPLSEMAMLARSPIEILGDTEKILAERVGLWATVVHLSEFQASRRPARAIAWGANMAENCGGTRVKRHKFCRMTQFGPGVADER